VVVDNGPVVGTGQGLAPAPPPAVSWQPPATPGTSILVPGTTGLEYAGWVPRAAAYLLDGLVLSLVAMVLAIVVGLALRTTLVASLLLSATSSAPSGTPWGSRSSASIAA
jgi:hypothetical protein